MPTPTAYTWSSTSERREDEMTPAELHLDHALSREVRRIDRAPVVLLEGDGIAACVLRELGATPDGVGRRIGELRAGSA